MIVGVDKKHVSPKVKLSRYGETYDGGMGRLMTVVWETSSVNRFSHFKDELSFESEQRSILEFQICHGDEASK